MSWSSLGNEQLDGLADDLVVGVAVQPFGRRVPAGDGAVQRLGDDGIIRVVDQCRHALGVRLRLPLFGHVAGDPDSTDDRAVRVADR